MQMSEHFPDFLRAAISTTANVLLMMTLLQPRYSKKITLLTMLGIWPPIWERRFIAISAET